MTQESTESVRNRRATHWRGTQRLTLQLSAVWFVVTFGVIIFARELSGFTIFGWPFSFYMAAQGTTLIYVGIVAFYAWRMRRLDAALKGEQRDGQ